MNVVLAIINDFSQILKLSIIFDSEEINKEEKISKAIKNKLVWVVKDDNKVVGYILVELFDEGHDQLPNSIFISELYVLESYRKQGVGKILMQAVLENKSSTTDKPVVLDKYPKKYTYFSLSHDPAEKTLTDFYKSFGFDVVGETKAHNIKMIRKI